MQSTEQILASTPGSSQLPTSSQTPSRVLVVEPHPTLRTVLVQRLRQDGHLAAAVGTAAEAIDLCREQSPDLLVSAEILEQNTAMRLAQQLGSSVIVLTARSGVEALVNLLDEGADDVLRKPFGLEELAARCRTLLKRGRIGLQEKVEVGPLEVHLLLRQVTLSEKPVELSPREFALLCALLMPPGMVRSRQELLRMARSRTARSADGCEDCDSRRGNSHCPIPEDSIRADSQFRPRQHNPESRGHSTDEATERRGGPS